MQTSGFLHAKNENSQKVIRKTAKKNFGNSHYEREGKFKLLLLNSNFMQCNKKFKDIPGVNAKKSKRNDNKH